MPVNEHSAAITKSKNYVDFARKNDFYYKKSKNPADKGIDVIFGVKKEKGPRGGRSEIQSVRFDSTKWEAVNAQKWLEDHKIDYLDFKAADKTPGDIQKEESQAAITTGSLGAGAYHRPKTMNTVYRHKPDGFKTEQFNRKEKSGQPFLSKMKDYLK